MEKDMKNYGNGTTKSATPKSTLMNKRKRKKANQTGLVSEGNIGLMKTTKRANRGYT